MLAKTHPLEDKPTACPWLENILQMSGRALFDGRRVIDEINAGRCCSCCCCFSTTVQRVLLFHASRYGSTVEKIMPCSSCVIYGRRNFTFSAARKR